MKLHRLSVSNFARVTEASIEFGPGLNVLYGENDLGKSTLADAIRLALLLPYGSTHCEPYVPWSGGADPVVELTFTTELERFWRVRKQFGRSGFALLQESRNGRDFDDVERSRGVERKLRELLRWGIPEPGGAGASKGLPASFLTTALLSTQAEVTALLGDSLKDDAATSGRERIAAALQAVGQDPLFGALLRQVQARHDAAYTDAGAKKRAKGTVYKEAADRLNEARDEKERLRKIVDDSQSVERELQELSIRRDEVAEAKDTATMKLADLERLARQAADREDASDRVRTAAEAVLRITKLDQGIVDGSAKVQQLAAVMEDARVALSGARELETAAEESLNREEATSRVAGSDPETADTLARQALQLRQAGTDQEVAKAQRSLDAASAAHELVHATEEAARLYGAQDAEVARVRALGAVALESERVRGEQRARYDQIDRALELQAALATVATRQDQASTAATFYAEAAQLTLDITSVAERRAALKVPDSSTLPGMRKVETQLAGARSAVAVGLLVTVLPRVPVQVASRRDGVRADPAQIAEPLEIEASSEVEVDIGAVATVRVQGGRRDAQTVLLALEQRWLLEIEPLLRAAGARDIEALAAGVEEARTLDQQDSTLRAQLESLRLRIAALGDPAELLRQAEAHAKQCRDALQGLPLPALQEEIVALGPDPVAELRMRRQKLSDLESTARSETTAALTSLAQAEERARVAKAALEAAVVIRDASLASLPDGLELSTAQAKAALATARADQELVARELADLQDGIQERARSVSDALAGAREALEQARTGTAFAQDELTKAIAAHATEGGAVDGLRRLREAEDLVVAEARHRDAAARLDSLPMPTRVVARDEIESGKDALAHVTRELEDVEKALHEKQGALKQVGGAVVREQLRDAEEAFDRADRHERETESDYEAWKLLLQEMKEADAAQASNLGQALEPRLTERFQALTSQRYQSVRLTAQLETEGVMVAGVIRPPDRMSVGTREQLCTLYRLCLGEHLQTAVVLDDQLVQSDATRMGWFREILVEKARVFQIVVFTCRPSDYLPASAMPGFDDRFMDSDDGFVRAIDLDRALGERQVS